MLGLDCKWKGRLVQESLALRVAWSKRVVFIVVAVIVTVIVNVKGTPDPRDPRLTSRLVQESRFCCIWQVTMLELKSTAIQFHRICYVGESVYFYPQIVYGATVGFLGNFRLDGSTTMRRELSRIARSLARVCVHDCVVWLSHDVCI